MIAACPRRRKSPECDPRKGRDRTAALHIGPISQGISYRMRHLFRLAGSGLAALLASISFSALALAAPTYGYRVLHHESVEVTTRKGVGANEHLSFEAYGRRFDVTVSPNERIRRG